MWSMMLLRPAVRYLGRKGCHKVLAFDMHETGEDQIALSECGFGQKNMLTIKLNDDNNGGKRFDTVEEIHLPKIGETITISADGPESDPIVVSHWKKMWLDVGIPEGCFVPEMEDLTTSFIEKARSSKHYQTFVARSKDGNVVGSVSCQVWDGPIPLVVKEKYFRY